MCGLAPRLELGAERLEVLSKALRTVLLMSPGVALAREHLLKHQPPQPALLSNACHQAHEPYTPFAYRRINDLGLCLEIRVAVADWAEFMLSFLPAESPEEHRGVDLP